MHLFEKLHILMDIGGDVVSNQKWANNIADLELTSPLKPIFTKPVDKKSDHIIADEEECLSVSAATTTTTTCAESRIPSRLLCPTAPRKPKSTSSSSRYHNCCNYSGFRDFFHPPDQLEAIFIRRLT
ncbi:hypothetical protein OROMI_023093 [Orobanche minor]